MDSFMNDAEQLDDMTMLALHLREPSEVFETTADADQTVKVSDFVEALLEKNACPAKVIHQALIAVDEIFSNIVRYSGAKKAVVRCLVTDDAVTLEFEDDGKAYNPLAKADPDVTAPREEREIGGLGIFVVKKMMDGMQYNYKNGRNILTIKKECHNPAK